jgi:aminobenzoyl-glutamate utilization protein B
MDHAKIFKIISELDNEIYEIARKLWENPELSLHEYKSSELLHTRLADAGFNIQTEIGGLPTAFKATYGESKPHVGLLGEFDALPGLSQAVTTEREPIEASAPGHGCGHNLFAAGCLGAALGIKKAIQKNIVEGTITFYACPAEEILAGKVFMARDGAFDDLDAALTWHPSHQTVPFLKESLAMNSLEYTFHGESAHAANSPESGRSALDGVQIMNMGIEFMREHISDQARIHYTIKNGNGAPNVVPNEATVWYYIRAPTRGEVNRINEWVDDVAIGAAAMTQTEVTSIFHTGCYNYIPNQTLSNHLNTVLERAGSIPYTDEDYEFAGDLQSTLSPGTVEARTAHYSDIDKKAARELPLYSEIQTPTEDGKILSGSTDVGDVSWITPTAQFWAASWPVGTPAHSWQAVAASGGFGQKAALYAAKVLAATSVDIFQNQDLLVEAKEEFESQFTKPYNSPLSQDTEPPFHLTL